MHIPVISSFVDGNEKHLCDRVVDAFHITVAVGVIGTRSDVSYTKALKDGHRELGAELETVVGQNANRVAPERHALDDQDIGGACECRVRHGVHICSPAETVR